MSYLILKYIHILSLILLFGTGLGTAFYKWIADRNGNTTHIAITNRHVVLADWIFTTPAVIIQPITGIMLASLMELPLTTPWLAASLVLYAVAGACWLPVLWLQIRMRDLSKTAADDQTPLPSKYWHYARIWFYLGVPAFIAMVLIVFLMIFKPALGG